MNIIGLVDCNNFFVSCERAINPELDGVPMVVMGNNGGCIVARSNEAKALGIKMGQPAFEIRHLLESGKVLGYTGNHLLYREKSIKVHKIFARFAPKSLDYSVDESFLIMDGIPLSHLQEIGEAIVECCWREERIPVTIGFAPTKTLAKIATEISKKNGIKVCVKPDVEQFIPIMDALPIGELWGIGRKLNARMYQNGVYSIGDFYRKDLRWVRQLLGVNGERSWRELHGESCIELSHLNNKLQDSISETRTFPRDIFDIEYLRVRIADFAVHVARRLRDMGGEATELSVFLQSNRFHPERGFHSPHETIRFHSPLADSSTIASAAQEILERLYSPAIGYKRAGVTLSGIKPSRTLTPSLFDDIEAENRETARSRKLMSTIDSLNSGIAGHILKMGSQISPLGNDSSRGYISSFGAPKDML